MKSSAFERMGLLALAVGILWVIIATPCAAAPRGKQIKDAKCCSSCQMEDCCTCSRELWRVLLGGGTTLAALVVSLGRWYISDFHVDKKQILSCLPKFSIFRVFLIVVGGILVPQIFMSFVLSSALSATVLQQRVKRKDLAKRLSAMVVWIMMDKKKLEEELKKHNSLRELSPDPKNESPKAQEVEAPDVEDALVLYSRKLSGDMKNTTTDTENSTRIVGGLCSSLCGRMDRNRSTAPSAVELAERSSAPEERVQQDARDQLVQLLNAPDLNKSRETSVGYLCSQDWDPKNRLWKEAMLETDGVLPRIEEVTIIESRTKWECGAVAMQSLGYLSSIASRFAGGRAREVTPVEMMSSWISIVLLVQVLVIPTLVTFCKKGMCLHLPEDKIDELIQYYECRKEQQNNIDLTLQTRWLFGLCISFLFALFLILIPALVYYYYDLPESALSFASLLLFTDLSGIAIVAFVLTLIFPPQQVLFAFTAFPGVQPRKNKAPASCSDYMPVISSVILLLGLSAYVLAIADTVLNWDRFSARDCYISSILIPHVG